MSTVELLPPSPISGLRTLELGVEHEPLLQQFFEANPAYFLAVQGEPPTPGEAKEEIEGELPAEFTYTKKWVIGYLGQDGTLAAMATLVSDILAPTVWCVSTFIVATARHGCGDAKTIYESLEAWAASHGACWLRLGVVAGHTPAERFWSSRGYVETRTREGYRIGRQLNTLRVMYKPLSGGTLADYLSLVERDRPEGKRAD